MHSKQNRLRKKFNTIKVNMVSEALERNGWRLTATAEALGMPFSTLQSLIKSDEKLAKSYEKHGHGRGRPFGRRKPK